MQATISSDKLTVVIDSFGAELHSIKDSNGREYLWQADERVWKRHAPVLFPFICNTASKKYTVDGKEYALSNHGFARDSEFELSFAEKNCAGFTLSYNDETLKKYPYKFGLEAKYELDGAKLTVTYTAENKDTKPMYFFLGGHPAFRCPLNEGEDFSDYYIEYEKNEDISRNAEDIILNGGNKVELEHKLFKNDVFMKDAPNSSWVALVGKNGGRIKLDYDKKGCIAVWSSWLEDDEKTQAAEFVCLEPWSSVPVYESGIEELTEMPDALRLEPNEKYAFSFTITIE